MYMILLVLNDPDLLEDLLIAWEEEGIEGVTVLFSTGLGRLRQLKGWRDDMPLIPSLSDFYEVSGNLNRTVFTVIQDEEKIDAVLDATKSVVGDLDENKSGLMLVLPVAQAFGMKKRKAA